MFLSKMLHIIPLCFSPSNSIDTQQKKKKKELLFGLADMIFISTSAWNKKNKFKYSILVNYCYCIVCACLYFFFSIFHITFIISFVILNCVLLRYHTYMSSENKKAIETEKEQIKERKKKNCIKMLVYAKENESYRSCNVWPLNIFVNVL